MGEITIRLQYNLTTGKKDLFIGYESEEDLTGHEHESRHREIVRGLIGRGMLTSEESGDVVIERIRPTAHKKHTAPEERPALSSSEDKESQQS